MPRLPALLLALIAFPAGASASATNQSPANGASVDSATPQLAWTLPAGETSEKATVAVRSSIDAAGALLAANVVEIGGVAPAATFWAPTHALGAGTFWWNVATRDGSNAQLFSTATRFVVPPSLRLGKARANRGKKHRLFVYLPVVTNLPSARVSITIRAGKKVVGTVAVTVSALGVGVPTNATLIWKATVKKGKALTIAGRVRAGGLVERFSLPAKAP